MPSYRNVGYFPCPDCGEVRSTKRGLDQHRIVKHGGPWADGGRYPFQYPLGKGYLKDGPKPK